MSSRRGFLAALPAFVLCEAAGLQFSRRPKHPDPRPGITAAKVLTRAQLEGDAEAIRVFDLVRQIPRVADGIRCPCGCADFAYVYSLLSCYEAEGMARYCDVCRGAGELAYQLHSRGRTLDQIRAAVDEEYG